MNISALLRRTQPATVISRYLNCWTASITTKHRSVFEKTYPTTLVLPDGSSVTIQYHEPRQIIVLPADPNSHFQIKYTLKPKISTKTVYKETKLKSNFNRKKYF